MNTEMNDFLSVLRFLHYLRRHFLVLILSVSLISFLAYNYFGLKRKYPASARFIVNNVSNTNTPETVGTDNDLKALRGNSLQLFFSTEVMDGLIKRYDLYPCYHISRDSVFGREKLMRAIRASVEFKVDKIGGHELIVTTYDRDMSAAIANALIEETDKLNGKLLSQEVMRKAEIMDDLIKRSNFNMSRNIDSLSSLTKLLQIQKTKSSKQEDVETRLYNALALLQQNMETMSRTRDYYDVILNSNLSNNFHFFYVVAEAVPDDKNYFWNNILIATALASIFVLGITMGIYYIQRQLAKIRELGLYPEAKTPSLSVTKSDQNELEEPAISYQAKST